MSTEWCFMPELLTSNDLSDLVSSQENNRNQTTVLQSSHIDCLVTKDPFKQFGIWFNEARKCGKINEPEAMCLATCSQDGKPSCRMICMREFNEEGFTFYTHCNSKKSQELESNPQASVCFYWDSMRRQVCMDGWVKKLPRKQSVEWFEKRPLEAKLNSLISDSQERTVRSKQFLKDKMNTLLKEFKSAEVPAPENWGGYVFVPQKVEFWQGDPKDNLNDRILFRKGSEDEKLNLQMQMRGDNNWIIERLTP